MLAAVIGIVVFDLLVSASHSWPLAKIGYQDASVPPRLVRDADVDPFSSFGPTAPLITAGRFIPRNATYSIVIGKDPPTPDPGLVRRELRLWLLPRTYVANRADAQWVVAYHESSEKLGIKYSDETGLGAPGTNVVRVEH
jgi:hypothetical protein